MPTCVHKQHACLSHALGQCMDMFKADVHAYPSYVTVYTFLCVQQVKSDTSDDHASKRNTIKIERVNVKVFA